MVMLGVLILNSSYSCMLYYNSLYKTDVYIKSNHSFLRFNVFVYDNILCHQLSLYPNYLYISKDLLSSSMYEHLFSGLHQHLKKD